MTYGTLISTQTLSVSATSINFNAIGSTFKDLLLVVSARSDRASGLDQMNINFNGSSSSYYNMQLLGFGTGSGYSEAGGTTYVYNYGADGATATSNTFGNTAIYIPNYASSTLIKVVGTDQVFEINATGGWQGIAAGSWGNTAAITSIAITPLNGPNWVAGTTASLYGIK